MIGGYYDFEISITLGAPFLLAGNERRGFGIDIAHIRDRSGRLVIPDTHIKGVLRHAWEYTGAKDALGSTQLFGYDALPEMEDRDPTNDAENVEQARELGARLFLSDLIGPKSSGKLVSRVSIDDTTGTAKKGHLLNVEQVALPGEEVTFKGRCTAFLGSDQEAGALREHLRTALSSVSSLGRFKTVGYGRITDFEVSDPDLTANALGPAHAGSGIRYTLRFTPDKPFLVDAERPDANTLKSAEAIPGGAVKGTLAKKFQLAGRDPHSGPLGSALSRMRIGHAFAKQHGQTAETVSYDHVAREDLAPTPCAAALEFGFVDEDEIPRFEGDWKTEWWEGWQAEGSVPDALDIQWQNRTRLAIDPNTGASWPSRLFSTSCVEPENDFGPIAWEADISWPGDTTGQEFAAFQECLGQFETGLFTLGKTNARIVAEPVSAPPASALQPAILYRVEITTAANLILPKHLDNEARYIRAFDAYWRAVSDDALCLAWEDEDRRYLAEGHPESMARAVFVKNDYRNGYHARSHSNGRDPYVVTLPGSVFFLAALDPVQAAEKLTGLIESGLPVPVWNGGGPDVSSSVAHSDNPFVPQNGYAAIRAEEVRS